MECHECAGEAVGKCSSCGLAFCSGHGAELCRTCAVAFTADEPGPRRPTHRVFLQCENRPRMPTIYLDDDGPPSCHVCDGLARHICGNCHNLFCPEHAGRGGWCAECTRVGRTGMFLSLGVFAFIGAILFLMYALDKVQR